MQRRFTIPMTTLVKSLFGGQRALRPIDPRSSGFAAGMSVAAIIAAVVIGSVQAELPGENFPLALAIAAALVASRYIALRYRFGAWAIALDAIFSLVTIRLTGAPHSEFGFIILAGLWWAGRLLPRSGAAVYAAAFAFPYVVLVLLESWGRGALADAAVDLLTVCVIALLVDWFMAVDKQARALANALAAAKTDAASAIEVRRRLALAAGESPLSVDTLIVAGQVGLTADQIELLGYLLLGFGNHQIAEAIGRSEATVRYRLTSLYRSLGVRGRRSAIQRARELGLDSLVQGLGNRR
jgi:DNA-binding CsgD family transcriptional regulator